ncbi:MAG: TssN family type VI secretion system protein [Bacteroidetes bacterium]|nr:TssN family type VI secretion system protein [Bacteroidota bacterium]
MKKLLKYLPIPVIVLLVLGVVLVLIYKYLIASNPAITRKKNLGVGFLFSFLLGLLGVLSFIFFNSNITWYYLLAQVWVLGIGWLFWSSMKRSFTPYFSKTYLTEMVFMLIPLIFGLTLFVYLFLVFNNNNITWWFATCYLSFFIPYMIGLAFNKFAAIPPEIYKVWYHPTDYEDPDFERMDLNKMFLLDIEFSKNPSDSTISNFKAKAPLEMTFSDWFVSFIANYNMKFDESQIQYSNAEGEAHGWIFYTKGNFFTGKKYIDPDISIKANKLKENVAVVAKRVEVN